MISGTKVKWEDATGHMGTGMIIETNVFSPDSVPRVLVAVDAIPNMPHQVIYCAVTWLTEIQ